MYVVDGVGGGVRPEENLGVEGMRIYSGSAIFCRFEAQKMTFVIDLYQPEDFFLKCVCGGGGLKHPETSECDRKVQSSAHCFNKVRICIKR